MTQRRVSGHDFVVLGQAASSISADRGGTQEGKREKPTGASIGNSPGWVSWIPDRQTIHLS
jgi:hypothetical protein